MADIRQSPQWQNFMMKNGWTIEKFDGGCAFVKHFGPFGSFIKIQRPPQNPTDSWVCNIAKKHNAWQVVLESAISKNQPSNWKRTSPFIPSKTLQIKLENWKERLLPRKTKYETRKAITNGVSIQMTDRVEDFVKLWQGSRSFDFGQGRWIAQLYRAFDRPNRFTILGNVNKQTVAGALILIFGGMAYYMYAASNKTGRKMSAQYLVVTRVIEESKRRGAKIFDFEGVYDSRYHSQTKSWRGFTHFKKSFNGVEVEFPRTLKRNFWWGF